MTDPLDPPEIDPTDLAASSFIDRTSDDRTSDDEAYAVDPPELADRVNQFRALSSALSEPVVPPTDDVRDRQIAHAIATFGTLATAVEGNVGTAEPTSLAERRATKSAPRWVAVAAAVGLIAIAIPVLNALRNPAGDQQTTVMSASTIDSGTAAVTGVQTVPISRTPTSNIAAAPNSEIVPTTQPHPNNSPLVAQNSSVLGDVSTAEELGGLVSISMPADPPVGDGGSTPATSLPPLSTASPGMTRRATTSVCDANVQAIHPELGAPELITSASIDGVFVEVFVYNADATTGARYRILVVTPPQCQIIIDTLV
ncbi:MAG: hypothetical protein WCK41_11335 [Actinomycetes bacterium]